MGEVGEGEPLLFPLLLFKLPVDDNMWWVKAAWWWWWCWWGLCCWCCWRWLIWCWWARCCACWPLKWWWWCIKCWLECWLRCDAWFVCNWNELRCWWSRFCCCCWMWFWWWLWWLLVVNCCRWFRLFGALERADKPSGGVSIMSNSNMESTEECKDELLSTIDICSTIGQLFEFWPPELEEHQPIDIIDFGNLVLQSIKKVQASTGCCCCCCCCGFENCCCCCLLLRAPLLKLFFAPGGGLVNISAFNISGPLICSAWRASTRKAGSTVRVEVKVNLIPFCGCVWTTSWSQFSSVMSLTPSGGLAIIGTGYLLISAREISPETSILSAKMQKVSFRKRRVFRWVVYFLLSIFKLASFSFF